MSTIVPTIAPTVSFLAGGTGSGKSTIATILAARHDLHVVRGDRLERDWVRRCRPDVHPHLAALAGHRRGDAWRGRSAQQVFDAMAGRHGEAVGFLAEDLASTAADAPVLVDYFGVLPGDLAPLIMRPGQAVFLVPTPAFRRAALAGRYADPARARANWGALDPREVLEKRLARDALWDVEVVRQATALDLPVIDVDGTRPPDELTDAVERIFGMG